MDIINEREKTHGNFKDTAKVSQGIKKIIFYYMVSPSINDTSKEGIDMIVSKIGRILSGQWRFNDHWIDIAGYASLCNNDVCNSYCYNLYSDIAQQIKNQMAQGHNYFEMPPFARQTLEEIAECLAKITLGDTSYFFHIKKSAERCEKWLK